MRHKPAFTAARSALLSAANEQKAPPPAAIHLNINRITLHGYTSANQRRFTHSLEKSLAEVVGAHGDWSNATSLKIRRMSGGTLNPGASPEDMAMHVARQIMQQALPLSGGRHDA